MKRYTMQYSESRKPWQDGPREFTSLKAAHEHFDEMARSSSLDWRVGFLLRVRSGVTYRLFDRKKETVIE